MDTLDKLGSLAMTKDTSGVYRHTVYRNAGNSRRTGNVHHLLALRDLLNSNRLVDCLESR